MFVPKHDYKIEITSIYIFKVFIQLSISDYLPFPQIIIPTRHVQPFQKKLILPGHRFSSLCFCLGQALLVRIEQEKTRHLHLGQRLLPSPA